MYEFEAFPKIPRLRQNIIVTEKVDGTNAQIAIVKLDGAAAFQAASADPNCLAAIDSACGADDGVAIYAGSRTKWVTASPKNDNYGFAAWVLGHAYELIKLGPGRHFGEWYGAGIRNNGYGLPDRRFALFNTARWGSHNPNTPACCQVVPVLGSGEDLTIDRIMADLWANGSVIAPGFMNPEGVVVYYTQSRTLAKRTFIADGGKWQVSNG